MRNRRSTSRRSTSSPIRWGVRLRDRRSEAQVAVQSIAMTRKPRGYEGVNHETIGSDILSVLRVVTFPERTLGVELLAKVQSVQPDGWYPIEDLLEMMERIEATIGRTGLVQMGRNLFRLSHEARVKEIAKSAGDIVFGINDMYLHANRGQQIGGWKVVSFKPGAARLEKTTPHHCAME